MSPRTVSGRELRANTPRAAVAKGKVETHLAKSLQEDCDPHKLSRHSCGGDWDILWFPRHQQSPLISTYIVLFRIKNCSWILSSWWFSATWHFLVKHSSYVVRMCQEKGRIVSNEDNVSEWIREARWECERGHHHPLRTVRPDCPHSLSGCPFWVPWVIFLFFLLSNNT